MNYTWQRWVPTSHAGVDTCSDVHSYLVCQDCVLLNKYLSRRVYRTCRCCSEDIVSSISPNKTTESTTEVNHSAGASCPLHLAPHFAKGLLWAMWVDSSRPLCTPDLSSRKLWGLADMRAERLYQLWATVATVSTLWPASSADKLQWGRTAHRTPG